MTAPLAAPALPRSRTMAHPGPFDPVRLQHMHAATGRHFRLALEPGRTLQDAIVEQLQAHQVTCASMTILGGRLSKLLYCVAPADPTGERVANYTRPVDVGAAYFIFGNATLGKNGRGEPVVHCHATFVCEDGQVRGGHIVVDRSTVADEPVPVLATSLDGFELRISLDAETHMPLMRPFALEPDTAVAAAPAKEAAHV